MQLEPLRGVLCPDRSRRIGGHRRRRWYLGQRPAIRPSELESAVGRRARPGSPLRGPRGDAGGRVARGSTSFVGPPVRPVAHVMPLGRPGTSAAREAAAPVPMLQCPPQRRRDRPRPAPRPPRTRPSSVVPHHHPARVARQPPRRFRGNVRALLQRRLPRLLGSASDRGVHVHHHLVPLARRPRVELVMQRRLRQQGQRVRLLLGRVGARGGSVAGSAASLARLPLVQRLAGRVQRPQEQRADLRCQPPAQHHGAVLILVDVQGAGPRAGAWPLALRPAGPRRRQPRTMPLHVGRRARPPHRQQPGFGLRGRDARQGADLGVGELAAGQRLGQRGQRRRARAPPGPARGRRPGRGPRAKPAIRRRSGSRCPSRPRASNSRIRAAGGRSPPRGGAESSAISSPSRSSSAMRGRRGTSTWEKSGGRVSMASPLFLLRRL